MVLKEALLLFLEELEDLVVVVEVILLVLAVQELLVKEEMGVMDIMVMQLLNLAEAEVEHPL
jgi:hypothetical protein